MDQQLLIAAEEGDTCMIGKITQKCPDIDVNVKTECYKDSALALACKGGYYNIAKLLIEAGAKVNAASTLGVTPLHFAAKGGHTKVIKLLVINEANLDAVNLNGIPPIGFTPYNSTDWKILHDAKKGKMPVIIEPNPVPVIPEHAIQAGMGKPKKEKAKKGKGKGKGKGKKKKK